MTLIEEVRQNKSVSVVGLAKNAGKTQCLNYILHGLKEIPGRYAVTSIGVDGETTDVVTRTPKPEITLFPGMTFVTSESHYRMRRLPSEILDVSQLQTALGRLVTARAIGQGKIMLSGPADTMSMSHLVKNLTHQGHDTVLIDGALSRLSLGSPAVADAIVLATGAAVSRTISGIVRQTKYVYDLINLPQANIRGLENISQGVWAVTPNGEIIDLGITSAFLLEKLKDRVYAHGTTLFVAGAVTDKMLEFLRQQPQCPHTTLIMRDFTCMFATPENFYTFIKKGGTVKVMRKTRLLAVCVNPTSPQSVTLDSHLLCDALREHISVPVTDIMLTA